MSIIIGFISVATSVRLSGQKPTETSGRKAGGQP